MIDTKNVGKFIAEHRKSKGWTQKQLGEQLGVTDRAVSKWETGRSLPDIGLIEDICRLFDLQVSELLAGRRMEKEEYTKETEQMLMHAIGESQLYGFQIVLYLLEISGVLALSIPFILSKDSFLPKFTVENVMCWIIMVLVLGSTIYLDHKLPAREYRSSNLWIEILNCLVTYLIMFFFIFYMTDAIELRNRNDICTLIILAAVGLIFVIVARISSVRWRKGYK